MRFDISFKKRDAIALEKDTLKKLTTLLDEQYPNASISISASLKNAARVRFDNIEELLAYDNSGKYSIEKLSIRHYNYSHNTGVSIDFEQGLHMFFAYSSTICVSFEMESKDDCIAFRAKLEHIFEEMRLPFYYTFLSKISFLSLVWGVVGVVLGSFLIYMPLSPSSAGSDITIPITQHIIFTFAGSILIILILGIPFGMDHFWARLFPPIQYLWGKGIEHSRNIGKKRANIFWVILMGIVVGIIVTFLSRFI